MGEDAAQIQNDFYDGWQHYHFVNCLFMSSPDGVIRICFFNCPGTVHDSTMAMWGDIYTAIDEMYQLYGARVVVDSAFGKEKRESLLRSQQNQIASSGVPHWTSKQDRDAKSLRQLSEWGMRGLQGSFPRLKDRIMFEDRGERKLIIQSIILLYNFRASTVGQNQIRTTFCSALARSANQYLLN